MRFVNKEYQFALVARKMEVQKPGSDQERKLLNEADRNPFIAIDNNNGHVHYELRSDWVKYYPDGQILVDSLLETCGNRTSLLRDVRDMKPYKLKMVRKEIDKIADRLQAASHSEAADVVNYFVETFRMLKELEDGTWKSDSSGR